VAPVAPRQAFRPAAKHSLRASNGTSLKTRAFLVWQPVNNKYFETFSFLPALSNDAIVKQVDYIVNNGWTPCLEFADPEHAYVSNENCIRFSAASSGYQDNRYWTMWKLPMFGCSDGTQVLKEIDACQKAFPNAYVRLVAFDPTRQVQVAGFLVHRPSNAKEWRKPEERSTA
jgi:ribulose-bisphosphate carboxylase small chain